MNSSTVPPAAFKKQCSLTNNCIKKYICRPVRKKSVGVYQARNQISVCSCLICFMCKRTVSIDLRLISNYIEDTNGKFSNISRPTFCIR